MADSVSIRSCASREEAELLKSLLEANGIHAMVSADDYVGLPLQVSGGVQLIVLQQDAERARHIIQKDQR
jgi:hypothetical protein